MFTGMEEHQLLVPVAGEAMELWKAGYAAAAIAKGEEFWAQIPQPPVTDGDRLSQQLSLMIGKSAVDVDPSAARTWLTRARAAYSGSTVSYLCDFLEATICLAEGDERGARAFFDKAVAVAGMKAFAGENERYRKFYKSKPTAAPSGASAAELAEQGEALSDKEDYTGALELWEQALAASSPADEDLRFWLYASMGDAHFQLGEHLAAAGAEDAALRIGGTGNPFVWLRLGQANFELGNLERAADALVSAYMLEGDEIFEDEDPKYRVWLVEQGLIKG